MLVKSVSGRQIFDVTQSSVFTRPSWMPISALRKLHNARRVVFVSALASLGAGAFLGDDAHVGSPVRVGVAVLFSLYHLLENSMTNRHGEFPVLYAVWALCIPDPHYASALCYGSVIHFILSSGVSKLLVGGPRWLQRQTMQCYLRIYGGSKTAPPLSKALNRRASVEPWVTASISVATIFLECAFVPMTLFMSPPLRFLGCAGLIAMHVGIATLMSARVGIVFLTTLPVYVVGFSCQAPVGAPEWWSALGTGIAPSLLVMATQTLLPDDWPCSALSLFMWSGEQADAISRNLMTGDLRVVLATAAPDGRGAGQSSKDDDLLGLPVLYHGGVSRGE